jgi:hypothetical protein
MRTLHAVLLALLVLVLAAPALADNEVVRELTSQGGVLGPDYLPKKQEYRLDPSTDFHYSSDPFLREKTGDGVKEAKKPSPFQFSVAPEERYDPITGQRIEPQGSDDDPLSKVGGKVQMDVNVMEF